VQELYWPTLRHGWTEGGSSTYSQKVCISHRRRVGVNSKTFHPSILPSFHVKSQCCILGIRLQTSRDKHLDPAPAVNCIDEPSSCHHWLDCLRAGRPHLSFVPEVAAHRALHQHRGSDQPAPHNRSNWRCCNPVSVTLWVAPTCCGHTVGRSDLCCS